MTKFSFVVLLLFYVNAFSQDLIKTESLYPEMIYHINFTDSITYIFSEKGMHVFKNTEGLKHEFLNEISFDTSHTIISEINGNQFIIFKEDTIFYYDISDPTNPDKINQWSIRSGLSKITKFSSNYVFEYGDEAELVSINNNEITQLKTISTSTNKKVFNYPYFILEEYYKIEFYRFLPDNSHYLERIITDNRISHSASNGNYFLYSTYTPASPPFAPYSSIKIIDITHTTFPYIYSYTYWSSYYLYSPYYITEYISQDYFSGSKMRANPLDYKNISTHSGNTIIDLPIEYNIRLNYNNKAYAYCYDKDIYSFNNILPRWQLYGTFNSILSRGSLLKIIDDEIFLMKVLPEYKLQTEDSTVYMGTLIVRDSIFYTKENNFYKKYSIIGNSIIQSDSFNLPESNSNMIEIGKYYYLKKLNSAKSMIYKRDTTFNLLYSTVDYPTSSYASIYNESLFILDSLKGIARYKIINDSIVVKWWHWGMDGNYYNCIRKDSLLVIRENNKLFLLDIQNSFYSPAFLDTFNLISDLSYFDLYATDDAFYLKGKLTKPILFKFNIENNRIVFKYPLNLPKDTEYSFTEANQKLIILTPREIYWFKDTTIVSNIDYDFTEIPVKYELLQNYPNPFNSTTIITYRIAEAGMVSIKLYDILGREVIDIINERKTTGEYKHQIDANHLSSGVYLLRLKINGFISSKKIVLVR